MHKDKMQIRQNAKRQNANPTKYKKTICKYDKTQKWQYINATKYKYDKT